MKKQALTATLILAALAVGSADWVRGEPSKTPAGANIVQAISQPSQDVTITFSRPGRVASLKVKRGETVQKDQILAQQDDREELAQLKMDESKAKDMTEIQIQEKVVAQKKVDYQRIKIAYDKGAKSQLELDDAALQIDIEQARLDFAKFNHTQAEDKAAQTRAVVDKMKLTAPISGVVEQIITREGESVDQQAKMLRIVNVDPLWLDVPVPLATARNVKVGAEVKVNFPEGASATGKVETVGAVADAASETLNVRVEVANPEHRPAGERVQVDFAPAKIVAAEEKTK